MPRPHDTPPLAGLEAAGAPMPRPHGVSPFAEVEAAGAPMPRPHGVSPFAEVEAAGARPHGTYSIVALDPATGELGAAVQSHWFSVGSLCTWARPGIGAVATQSVVEPAHGPHALDRMRRGEDAAAALAGVLATDARGRVAVHTGADCIPEAGHVTGEHWACQANMMGRATVPDAMSAAFAASDGDLAERLMTALEGAEAEGGDVRGRQSAALLVAPAEGESWKVRMDLRVEDHSDPIGELRRLLGLQRAYELAGDADELMGEGRADEAAAMYVRASELAPQSDELLFWAGLAIAQKGDVAAGADAVRRAAQVHPGWLTLLDRLSPDFAPAGAAVRNELTR